MNIYYKYFEDFSKFEDARFEFLFKKFKNFKLSRKIALSCI